MKAIFNAHHYLIEPPPPAKIKNANCFIIQDFRRSVKIVLKITSHKTKNTRVSISQNYHQNYDVMIMITKTIVSLNMCCF